MPRGRWIQGAIQHPGALCQEMGVGKGQTINIERLRAAAKKKGKTGKRARLALTLRKLRSK